MRSRRARDRIPPLVTLSRPGRAALRHSRRDDAPRLPSLMLALAAALPSWLAGADFCARLLGGRCGGGRCRGGGRCSGHLLGGALESRSGRGGCLLHRPSDTLRGLSRPDSELVQPIPNSLLLLRIHRGVEEPLRLGLDVFAGASEVFAPLSQELSELLFPTLVAHGRLRADDQLITVAPRGATVFVGTPPA